MSMSSAWGQEAINEGLLGNVVALDQLLEQVNHDEKEVYRWRIALP
jgi:hypothetical protein